MLVVEPVQAAIWHCLNHYAYSDATFLAEKLLAESENEEAVFLLATCYYRQGRLDQTHHLLTKEGVTTPSAKFLLAKVCSDLKKFSEAESVLRGPLVDPRKELQLEEIISNFGDKAAFALQLLSKLYRKSEKQRQATDIDKKALKIAPFLWSSFSSLCSAGENVDPNIIWDADNLESLDFCTGANPVMNLINCTVTNLSGGSTPNPPVFVPTPIRAPATKHCTDKMSTPQQPPPPVCDSPAQGVETPLLYCNSISTTPHNLGSPGQISGVSTLNFTADSDISHSHLKNPFMPPPLRPKTKRIIGKQSNNSIGSFSQSFGVIGQTPSPGPTGIAAKLLEFSSPQVVLLSPSPGPPSPAPPPVLSVKSSLSSTPGIPPLRSSTPGAPRVAMAQKPDNTVKPQQVLGHANMITPSPVNLPTRRSSRLFGSTQSVKENSKGQGKSRLKSKSRTIRSEKQPMSENELNEINSRDSIKPLSALIESDTKPSVLSNIKPSENQNIVNLTAEAAKMQKSSMTGLLNLLKHLGLAYQNMCQYNCKEAIKLFENLPASHANSNYVQTLLGKCHFELADYKTSVTYFERVRESDPYRLEKMEYYSTALWHLGQEVALSSLAQELQNIDKLSPVTWCAAGNCFSHQKEHENAIKFFQRAVQVSSDFAYAYTLLGHEYVSIEELEKALSCFRTATRIDPRHYNAWYGMGLTYYKQERYPLADIYYKKALSINKFSPILMCHVAVVQHATNNIDAALDTLNRAISLSPKSALCKFEKASILLTSERYQEALKELMELKQIVPKESSVYFLIGKVHSKLGNTHLALMNYSWSMDLDPKGANSQIKDALDPALNRQAHEMGNQTEEVEAMAADDSETTRHQDFQGDISEQFLPLMGENTGAVSSTPGQSPVRIVDPESVSTGIMGHIMNDSDDSL